MSLKKMGSIALFAIAALALSSNAWAYAANCEIDVVSGPNNPGDATEVLSDSNLEIDMLHLAISHKQYGNTEIASITITGFGTGDEAADIESVKLYEDTDGSEGFEPANDTLLATNTFAEDDGTVVLTPATPIPVDSSDPAITYFIVYSIKASTARASTFTASWADAGDMTFGNCASGSSTDISAVVPIAGGTQTVTYGAAVAVEGTSTPTTDTAHPGDTNVPVMQLQLTADDSEGLLLASVAITDSGAAANAEMIAAVKMWNDVNGNGLVDEGETQIGTDAVFTSGTEMLTLEAGNYAIAAGTSLNLLVTYDFAGSTTASRDTIDGLLNFAKNMVRFTIAGPFSLAGCGGGTSSTTESEATPTLPTTSTSFTPSIEAVNLSGATSNRNITMTGLGMTGCTIDVVTE